MNLFDLKSELNTDKQPKCKGLVFRGFNNFYFNDVTGIICNKQYIKLLKRKSCSGCEHCSWIFDEIYDIMDCENLIFPEIENEKLYTISVTNVSRDYETGYVDDYDLEIVELHKELQDRDKFK